MKIAIDIDDTLTDTFDYLIPFVAEYFGADPEELRRKNISYANLPEEWLKDELDFSRKYFDRVVPDTPFKPDARWGVEELKKRGHEIVLITARTTDFYTDPYATTRLELEKGSILYDKLICTTDKGTACREEGAEVLFDDSLGNCAAAAAQGVKTFVFTSKSNRDKEAPWPRVANWKEAVAAVDRLEEERKQANG